MSWQVMRFPSVDEANAYFAGNNWNPISICAGHVANQLVVLFNVPGQEAEVAKEKDHREVPEDDTEEVEQPEAPPEEEEKPEEPKARAPRRGVKKGTVRLPVAHRGAKSKTVAKRKR